MLIDGLTRRSVLFGSAATIAGMPVAGQEPGRTKVGAPVSGATIENVRDYGALGDGTDDTLAIRAAIEAVGDFNGGVVYFPETVGLTYGVSTLHVPDRVWLVGAHRDVRLRKVAGSTGPVITHNTPTGGGLSSGFRNLTIDGNRDACPRGTDGIGQHEGSERSGYRGDQMIIENVTVENCRRHGLNVGDDAAATYLVTISNLFAHHNGADGLRLVNVFDSWVNGGWYASNGETAIALVGAANLAIHGKPQVEGFTDPPATGTWRGVTLERCRSVGFDGMTVTNCRGGVYISGSNEDIHIVGGMFAGNAQSAARHVDNINVSPGDGTINGLWVQGVNFRTLGGTDAVRRHITFEPFTGRMFGCFISDCLFSGHPAGRTPDPVTAFCAVTPTGISGYRYHGNVNLPDSTG